MKEHAQEYGVRRWAGDDLVELQSEPLEAIQKLVEPYAPCIIQGCEVNAAEKRIAPGMVALWELDEDNRKKGVKIARFEGCVTEKFPVYLTLKRTPEERVYVDGKNKPIAYDYTAQETTVENDVKDKFPLKITEDGGSRLVDTLGITQKLDREGGDASQTKVFFNNDSTDTEDLKSGNTLAKLFGGIKKWLDGKVDKLDGKGLSEANFTKEEKTKLNGIADNANNYTLPTASSSALGGIKTNYTANGKNYKVNVDGSGNAYVNVPWTDNNTTYGAATQSAAGLMSKDDKKKLDGIAEGANKITVDSSLSDTSANPLQNQVIKAELDKKAPALDRETAWKMIRELGNKVCLTTSTTDAISTSSYGRGAYRNSSEEAVAFLVRQPDDWETLCLIGTTASSVTLKNFFSGGPSGSGIIYTDNKNIWRTGEGLYINLMNIRGGLKDGVFVIYRNSTMVNTVYKTIVRISFILTASSGVVTAAVQEKIKNTYFAPLLVAAATGWSPNATASADGFMSAADKTKLDGIATGANRTEVDTALSTTSTNPVQNKIVKEALDGKAASSHTHSYLPLSGGTVTGDVTMQGKVRLQKKQVSGSTDHYLSPRLNFGDGEEVYMEEATDGHLTVYGKNSINLSTSTGISTIKVNGTAIKDALPTATTSASGLMSAADKKKLDTMQNPIPVGVYFLGPDGLRHSHGKDIKVVLNTTTKIYTIQVNDTSGSYTFLPLSYNGNTIVFNHEYINANNDFKIDCYIRTLDSSSKLATYTGFVMFQLS